MSSQRNIQSVPPDGWDVVIAGGGPAGATAAAHLARASRRVLFLDRQRFPRDKVCGDGLIADALGALRRLGVLAEVRRQACPLDATAVYSASRHRVDVDGEFLTLKRKELDVIIAERAASDGAVFAQASVSAIRSTDDGVVLDVSESGIPLRAKFVLIATGADDRLLQRATGTASAAGPSAVALRCYVTSRARIDRLLISYDREILPGYAWIFPMRGDQYNVGCGVFFRNGERGGVNLRTMFGTFKQRFPEARALFEAADHVTPLKGAPLRCGLGVEPAPDVPRVLAIGEAIGTTFPFTGEGIGKAMETGELAAATVLGALDTNDPSKLRGFRERMAQDLEPRYLGYRAAEKWLSRPWVTDFLARRAARSQRLRDTLGGILNETIDPRSLFSLTGIARAILS
jgi:geranylgeranyl reductase family protein